MNITKFCAKARQHCMCHYDSGRKYGIQFVVDRFIIRDVIQA